MSASQKRHYSTLLDYLHSKKFVIKTSELFRMLPWVGTTWPVFSLKGYLGAFRFIGGQVIHFKCGKIDHLVFGNLFDK